MKKTTAKPRDLTTAEVAERLEISARAVRGLIKRGRFPNAQKLPGSSNPYLIPISDVDHYLEVREARKKQKAPPVQKTD